jgi:hypothetical protein
VGATHQKMQNMAAQAGVFVRVDHGFPRAWPWQVDGKTLGEPRLRAIRHERDTVRQQNGESTARVPRSDVFGEHENKPGILVHGPLVKGIRGKIAIDIPGLQVRYHLRGWHHTDLHVFVRVQPAFGQVVAQ